MTNLSPEPPPVEIDRLTIRYDEIAVVESLSLSVERGDVYALLGRNGGGKSSTIRCLLGMQKPTAGQARLFGFDSWIHRGGAMRRVGVVPEEPDAPPTMTANQILDYCRPLYRRWNAEAVSERLYEFAVDRDKPFGSLSKGEKSQVMLSLALAHEPEILILDDPTLGLDAVARDELFQEIIVDLADRGTTIFITTHDLEGIERIANRVGILHNGRLIVDEPLEALKSRFRKMGVDEADSSFETMVAPMVPISIRRMGRSAEAIVSKFSNEPMETSPSMIQPMSLHEIFIALVGEKKERNR